MKIFSGVMCLVLSTSIWAAERLAFSAVDSNKLTTETQMTSATDNAMDLVWWIPVEFWQVVLSSDPAVTPEQVAQIVSTLQPYSVVAVVQADISAFGAFHFYDEAKISSGLKVEYISADGSSRSIPLDELVDPDVTLLLNQMTPVLTAAMGNLGENFFFFPMPDEDQNGQRIMSPYDSGKLRVTLTPREGLDRPPYEVSLPLDSLHLPRICPNGRPAHISWNYCPWSGKKLKK